MESNLNISDIIVNAKSNNTQTVYSDN